MYSNGVNSVTMPGCSDINECTVGSMGSLTRGTHSCVRTGEGGAVCYNTDGGYSCGDCDVGVGERREGQEGTIISHPGQGVYNYPNSMSKEWYIRVEEGHHVQLTVEEFLSESCCDRLYITFDLCRYGQLPTYTALSGEPGVPVTYTTPVGVFGINLYFRSDGSVNNIGWRVTWRAIQD